MTAKTPRLTVLNQPIDPAGVITEALPTALEPNEFTPRLLTLLSNALMSAQAQGFRKSAGRTMNEWRVLAAIAITPGQSASEIAEALSINKSLISPTVNRLAEEGLITMVDGPRGSRPMYLTPAGARVHDALLPTAQHGQDLITAELGDDDVRVLNGLLRRVFQRVRADASG